MPRCTPKIEIRSQVRSLVYKTALVQPVYVWRQEHSCERLILIEKTRWLWDFLFREPECGHFSRIQLSGKRECFSWSTFDGIVHGAEAKVHLRVITLRLWFAAEVYRRALAHTSARYPGFDRHHFEDGLRIGERILVFDSDTHILAWSHLATALWKVIEDEKITATELCLVQPCSGHGDLEEQFAYKKDNVIAQGHYAITLVVDRDTITREFVEEVEQVIARGETWPITDSPKTFDYYKDLADLFTEFSYPEIAVLNREEAIKPLSDADKELYAACDKLDIKKIRLALKHGANPNALRNEYTDTPLRNLVENSINNKDAIQQPELATWYRGDKPVVPLSGSDKAALVELLLRYGAHPDLHWFEEAIPLAYAALNDEEEIVAMLLKYGSDPSIQSFYDSVLTAWPTAWDYATDDFEPRTENQRLIHERIVAMFETMRPSPYYKTVSTESTIKIREAQAVAMLNKILDGKYGYDYKQIGVALDKAAAILEPLGLMEKHDALLNLAADYNTVALFKKCGRDSERLEKQLQQAVETM